MKIRSKLFLVVLSLIILVGCSRSGDFQYYLKNVSFKEHDRHLKNVEPNFEGPKFADDGHLLVPGTGMAIVFYDDNLEGNKEQSSFRKLTLVIATVPSGKSGTITFSGREQVLAFYTSGLLHYGFVNYGYAKSGEITYTWNADKALDAHIKLNINIEDIYGKNRELERDIVFDKTLKLAEGSKTAINNTTTQNGGN